MPAYELNLCYKNFPDLPEAKNAYNKGMMLNTGDDKKHSKNEKEDNDAGGRDFFFNEISAGLYQEFEVIKINKFNTNKVNNISFMFRDLLLAGIIVSY